MVSWSRDSIWVFLALQVRSDDCAAVRGRRADAQPARCQRKPSPLLLHSQICRFDFSLACFLCSFVSFLFCHFLILLFSPNRSGSVRCRIAWAAPTKRSVPASSRVFALLTLCASLAARLIAFELCVERKQTAVLSRRKTVPRAGCSEIRTVSVLGGQGA